ncbi:DUF3592 domain-containing protein [Aquimarina sp. 2201CG5-10]|uniref:DUF3592 domain-containing protein n=1 Tax=Aquimarina callyspongiae TaxID=3098150 RepID=UPI002AB388B8|nr:DUF3592 domain-containing protein [Aquimarina sp. 2201CG5-10]MDY8136251.1 hypothetical protein [Aquimarina sp. 2201CG5-10]
MINSKIIVSILLLLPCILLSQDTTEWVKTEGLIKEIEVKRSGRKTREIATVEFQTENKEVISTYIELFRIPFLGSFKSEGETISVHYDKNNPAIAKTESGKFISQYGLYILIALGIIFSAKNILKAQKFRSKS